MLFAGRGPGDTIMFRFPTGQRRKSCADLFFCLSGGNRKTESDTPVGCQGFPVAVPDQIFGLALFLDLIDRCHSLPSLFPPLAALGSLPSSKTGDPQYYNDSRTGHRRKPCAALFFCFPEGNRMINSTVRWTVEGNRLKSR